jgi:nitroreductase/FMN reductase (NADPH)
MNDTINLLMNHMSIRKYKDQKVEKEIVDTIIKCGQMAPTSSHFQHYTIIEIKDQRKKEFLSELAGGQRWVKEAPLVLLFCADLNRGKKYFEDTDKEVFSNTECYTVAVIDASLALQKSFIAAQSLGLGGVVVGGIRNDVEALSKEFKLPEMVAPLCLLCLGYPDENPGVKPRLPQEEIHKVDFYDDSNQELLITEYNQTVKDYYIERTDGKTQDTWTKRSGSYLMAKTRDEVGVFFRKIGFLKK